MTPDQLSTLTALAKLAGEVGSWPVATLILSLVIGPWIAAFILAMGQQRRLEVAIKLYEDNARLVEDFRELARSLKQLIEDSQGYMVGNTKALVELSGSIRTNQFCPAARVQKKTVEVASQ